MRKYNPKLYEDTRQEFFQKRLIKCELVKK